MSARKKTWILTLVKLAVAGLLIYWLVTSGKLDLGHVVVFVDKPWITVLAIVHFFLIGVILGSLRWHLLLRGVGISPPLSRTFSLQSIGLFFNTVMPGAVGGDIIKGVYVLREQQERSKSRAMMTILLDRVSGMFGLFTLGAISIFINWASIWPSPVLRSLAMVVLLLLALMLAMHVFVFIPIRENQDPFLKILGYEWPGMTTLKKIYLALRAYHEYPMILVGAWGLSILIQLATMIYFLLIARVIVGNHVGILDFATVFPLGILTAALPLAPGGVGVGHVAFDKLLSVVNISGGANIFNVYVLGYLSLSLLGSIPYILLRANTKRPLKLEVERVSHSS